MAEGWDHQLTEDRDGIRFSWNEWPSTRIEAVRCVVPMGCMYTPLKKIEGMPPPLCYEPVRCSEPNCKAILNPYCQVDFASKIWVCPFCLRRNQFPPHYAAHITEQSVPAELIPQFTTVEYQLPHKTAAPPAFLFVVDTCLDSDELTALKDSLTQALSLIPETAHVGLITFGTMVNVHEIGFAECPKSYVFKGSRDYDASNVSTMLGLPQAMGGMPGQAGGASQAASRFIMPLSEASFALESILTDLAQDPWPKPKGQRHARCTGTALSIAVSLLEKAIGFNGGRIMLFTGGPATIGPGRVASRDLTEVMRNHVDLTKGKAPYTKDAIAFYKTLAARSMKSSHIIDMFACSLDQVGLLEMKVCVSQTGGLVVLADSFAQSVFKESFRRAFNRYPEDAASDAGQLSMGFSAMVEVQPSRDFKVCGAIGPVSAIKKGAQHPSVSDTEIGHGGTRTWAVGGINSNTTIGFYFEVANKEKAADMRGRRRHLQIVTKYQHSTGAYRMRVTTVGGTWHSDPSNMAPVAASFDQEAAAALLARIAIYRTETEDVSDIMRWLDRSLIRLCGKFAEYTKGNSDSFRLSPTFALFPQFMYHFRRSPFVQTFNSSPDEAAYYRMQFLKEDVSNTLVMMQPSLISYGFEGPPQPVLLDIASVRPNSILLLDTFFHVVVFHGETIAAWRDQGYQERPEYANFKQLLELPRSDAQSIMQNRFPVPRYIFCDQHKSQARFLLAVVNPSSTHKNVANDAATDGDAVFTDDVSFQTFMKHLVQLTVDL